MIFTVQNKIMRLNKHMYKEHELLIWTIIVVVLATAYLDLLEHSTTWLWNLSTLLMRYL